MPALSVMLKPASCHCNMSCDYCFYNDEASKRQLASYGFMSDKTVRNIIRRTMLSSDSSINFVYQGGEPTLRGLDFFKQIMLYQNKYNKNSIRVSNSLQTNGFAIDDNWCQFFHENNFLIGLSIDGTEDIHNSLRHNRLDYNGTFHKVLQTAKLFDKHHVNYNILTVVTPDITRNIDDIYSFYKNHHWKYQQYIACLDPLGNDHHSFKYSLTPKIYGNFLVQLFNLWYQDIISGTAPHIRYFENLIGLAGGYCAEACDQQGTCSMHYAVEADGSVYPCDFYMLDDYYLGNFNFDLIESIDRKRKEISFIERSQHIHPDCQNCSYYKLCRNGCQRYRDFDSEINCYKNYFCDSYQIFFSKCYDKIMELSKKIAPKKL